MQQIATQAKVNQNLIFHHFTNKKSLWAKVKEDIVTHGATKSFKPDLSSLEHFVESVVRFRFTLYDENPDLAALTHWQLVEEDEGHHLEGGLAVSPSSWRETVVFLQKRQQLDPSLDPDNVILLIAGASRAPFMQISIQQTVEQKETYQQLVIKSCVAALQP
jgi:AcrR family transcriptional regulator